MPLDEKSLSSAGIFAKDVLLDGSRNSGIFLYWLSLQVIINWEFNFQHTQDKLAWMMQEGDIGHL